MNALYKVFEQLRQNDRYKKEVERAREMFAFKPFAVEYAPIYQGAKYGRLLFSGFSVATGFTALALPFLGAVYPAIAYGLAGVLLVLIEWGKGEFLRLTFKHWYAKSEDSPLTLPAFASLALSVWLSLVGVQGLYKSLDTSTAQLQTAQAAQLDSLNTHYLGLIQAEKQALAEFKNSVSWRGKIDTYNPTNKAVIQAHTQRIGQLEADQRQAVSALANTHQGQLAETQGANQFNLTFWVIASAANELLILLSVWFCVFYAHRIAQDVELVENNDQRLHLSINDLQQFAQFVTFGRSDMVLPIAKTDENAPKTIGFKPLQKDSPDTPQNTFAPPLNPGLNPVQTGLQGVKNEEELRAFLAKYPEVVKCVKCGVSTTQTALSCGVSESTVHNVKRCLRVLNEID